MIATELANHLLDIPPCRKGMKLMMILGGLIGFTVSLGIGLSQEGYWPGILGRACVAALITGWLLRWWSHQWLKSLQEANRQRWLEARLKAEQKAAAEGTVATERPNAATHKP